MSYVTLAEARAEGIPGPASPGFSDDVVTAKIQMWSDFIDRATRQWFEPRDKTIDLDGVDSRTLFLPVPIISLDELYMNNDFTNVVPVANYKVYNSRGGIRDDRKNPKIEIASNGLGLYDQPLFTAGEFLVGTQNQRLVGTFGYVEEDDSTPLLIKRAVLKLVVRDLKAGGTLWTAASAQVTMGPVQSETTDGHSISYGNKTGTTRSGLNGITGDPEVDAIIMMYRGPMLITSTKGAGGPDRRWR